MPDATDGQGQADSGAADAGAAGGSSRWRSFRQRHLHDYPPGALALWLFIVASGALALGWALLLVLQSSPQTAGSVAIAVLLSAWASHHALKIPNTTTSFSASDALVFGALLHVGPAAAMLAAGIDGWVAARRTSSRLSSRVATPAAALAAMGACSWSFELVRGAILASGANSAAAAFGALLIVALVPYLGTMIPLLSMMALKNGAPMRPRQWLAGTSWMAALYLGAAFVAGLVHLASLNFGPVVLAVSVASVFCIIVLLRISFARQEAERLKQEARVNEAEREAELNQKRFTAAFTHAAIGMAVARPDGAILQVNAALCALLGADAATVMARRFCASLQADDAVLFRQRVGESLAAPVRPFSMELRLNRVDGAELWVSLHCSPYEDPSGAGPYLIYQMHDITSRQLAERRLKYIANHDTLTGLANRHCFHERLEQAVERTRMDSNERFAVLFMDLDRFKLINDSFGHHAGNELLCTTAKRLLTAARPGDLVARLGGDEFAVLLEQLHDAEVGVRVASRLLSAVSRPMEVSGIEVLPAASVGITFSDLGYRTVEEILRDADLAMYEAKADGRGRVAVFDQSMHDRVAQRLALENDLRGAIGAGQLALAFQPIFELSPQRITGFEALLRWTHPARGAVSPAAFIPLAEESGLIDALTDWVVEAAVRQLAHWQRDDPHLGINVNISGRDLGRSSFVEHLRAVLSRHALRPGSLTLEITETMLMSRLDVALEAMRSLRSEGIRFAIDDFGTGYSSLAYLSRLPIDSLKIDRAFVSAIDKGPQNLEIVRAIQQLGQSLGRRVVAEGIETAAQLQTLRDMGVHAGQGYLLASPKPADQASALLALERSEPP